MFLVGEFGVGTTLIGFTNFYWIFSLVKCHILYVHFKDIFVTALFNGCLFAKESRLQPYRHADHNLGVVGLGFVGLDTEADGEAT